MKSSFKLSFCSSLFVCGATALIACTYEIPTVNQSTGSSTSGSGSSSSGQGGSAPCEPGMSKSCMEYSGPPETSGIGACAPSTSVCLTSGTWAECTQEVTPTLETCASTSDVNCDDVMACKGTPLQSNPFTDAQTTTGEFIIDVDVANGSKGQDGAVYAVGGRNTANLKPLDLAQVLVWQATHDGVMTDWSDRFEFKPKTDPNGAIATGVGSVASNGDVIVTGIYVGGEFSIDGQLFANSNVPTTFYTKLSANGTVLVKRTVNNPDKHLETTAMAVDSSGKAYLVGSYRGAPQIDSVNFPDAAEPHGFILCLNPDGNLAWHQTFNGPGAHKISAITNINDESLVIATRFTGVMVVGNADAASTTFTADNEPDILVSRLRISDGLAIWNTQITGTEAGGDLEVGGLAADATRVAVSGRFAKNVTINGTTYSNPDGLNAADSFLAVLTTQGGAVTGQSHIRGAGLQDIRGLAIDSTGDVVITGSYSNEFFFADKYSLPASQEADAFVLKVTPSLDVKWGRPFGDGGNQIGHAAAVGKNAGHIYVGGAFEGQLSGINPILTSVGSIDAFLIKLSN